jgi:hypothetical protein
VALRFWFQDIQGTRTAILRGLVGCRQDLAVLNRMLLGRDFIAGMPWLVDNRDLSTQPTASHVARLVKFFRSHSELIAGSPIAFVGASTSGESMSCLFDIFSVDGSLRIRPFWYMDDAVEWALASGL